MIGLGILQYSLLFFAKIILITLRLWRHALAVLEMPI